MDKEQPSGSDYEKPVAYGVDGRPLYAHPSTDQTQSKPQTQAVHLIRPTEPEKQIVSKATKLKHEQSKRAFPECD